MVGFAMPRTAPELFQEILDGIQSDLKALDRQKTAAVDHDTPSTLEIAAMERIEMILRGASALVKVELKELARVGTQRSL
jgi:hypothetical protein